jgi:hypothetical protein
LIFLLCQGYSYKCIICSYTHTRKSIHDLKPLRRQQVISLAKTELVSNISETLSLSLFLQYMLGEYLKTDHNYCLLYPFQSSYQCHTVYGASKPKNQSYSIIRIKLGWWGGQACSIWGRNEMHIKFWLVNLKERVDSEDIGTDERIILKHLLKTQDARVWTSFIWLKMGLSCEHGNESSGSIKCNGISSPTKQPLAS